MCPKGLGPHSAAQSRVLLRFGLGFGVRFGLRFS